MRSIRALETACVAAACALLGSGGCGGGLSDPIPAAHDADAPPRRGGVFHMASFGDLSTLDPALAPEAFSTAAAHMIYAGLVDFDGDGNVVPDLAERIDASADGLTYRFTLHQGAIFHDGAEVTANDEVRSFTRMRAPETASPWADFFASVKSVEAEGRYVVVFHLKEPDATFLSALATTAARPVCPSVDFAAFTPCGAGPFLVKRGDWKRGEELRLTRHDRYFRAPLPWVDAVSWQLNVAIVTEGFKFAHGEIDVIRDLTQADTVRYQSDPRWKALGGYEPAHSITGDAMNTEIPPFDNVEVRRAVAAAIDRDHLALLKASNLTPLYAPVPPGVAGVAPGVEGQRYDLDAARAHMKKAGLEHGWPAPIPYVVYRQGLPEYAAQVVQQDLARIGLHLELRSTSFPTYLALTHRRHTVAMSSQGQTEDFPDPSDFLEHFFTRDGATDENAMNAAFYVNDRLDAILARARRSTDAPERARLYADAERIVCDDAPWAFEYAYRFFHVHQPYVRGYRVHSVWAEDATSVWIDRDDRALPIAAPLGGGGAR